MFSHRKEREELLEALVIRDEDFTPYNHYHQVSKEGTDRYNLRDIKMPVVFT